MLCIMSIIIDKNGVNVYKYGHYKTDILRGKYMSTYAIADAIEKFAENFKYAVGARNQIEKDKLAFEKEKFEYYKKQLNESNNKQSVQMSYGCEVPCRHDWVYDCSVVDILGRKERHRCRLCGEFKTVETARMV